MPTRYIKYGNVIFACFVVSAAAGTTAFSSIDIDGARASLLAKIVRETPAPDPVAIANEAILTKHRIPMRKKADQTPYEAVHPP